MIRIETNADQTYLRLEKFRDKALPENIIIGFNRALLYLRSKVDRALATGIYGVKTDTGGLRQSLSIKRARMVGNNVEGQYGSDLVYAVVQERGARITVTRKMSKFAWWKFKDTGLSMWRAIALKKGGQINIPAHWYMRKTAKKEKKSVLRIVERNILRGLK